MSKIIAFILMLIVSLPLFAKKQKYKKKSKNENTINSVSIRHTACFGRCPVYEIEVDNKGGATYRGISFTRDSGLHLKFIGKRKANEILNRFITFKIDTCKDRYESRVQDLPGVEVTINYTTKKKEIQNANLGPVTLKRCYASLDSLTNDQPDDSWHKVSDLTHPH